ncbi:phage terminase large subunit family protein [Haloarcula marina]|uniref:phage terminase large subunit family protein n=1 Tax=Haloarcula marina TaxID=2961574 RepID=UPI0020B7CBCE|nr:phage terminase large subunit family protein [Halomicroarcula marina]
MSDDTQTLGRCPDCDECIPTAWALVEYTKDDGTEGLWAECPGCEDVVAPE